MLLSKADPANCVRAILNFVLRRWLWLMPSPATALCLRETENHNHWLLNPAWAWTLCEYIILQCWVIPAKDISSACNWFVYIYKNLFRNGPMMHVLHAGCSQNSSAPPVDSAGLIAHSTREGSWSPGSGAHCAVFKQGHGHFVAGGVEVCSSSCFSLICTECPKQSAPLIWYCISRTTNPFCGFYVSVA